MGRPFRNSAAFGKRIEYWIVGKMLKEGLDVYLPLVDDDAIDAVVKRPDGKFIEILKARSETVREGDKDPTVNLSKFRSKRGQRPSEKGMRVCLPQ